MHFVLRSAEPILLVKNKLKWTQPWVEYYAWQENSGTTRPKKPTVDHWREDEIRQPLIADFKNNCCYCGCVVPTPTDAETSKGDVDHFLPKSVFPAEVYNWLNYVWSCKPCNQHKQEFYDSAFPLLNPCSEDDCQVLRFIEETGQYALISQLDKHSNWQQRLRNSELKTMLNSGEICEKRRFAISQLRSRFESAAYCLQYALPQLEPLQQQALSTIKEIMQQPDFKLLLQQQYQRLLRQHPAVAQLLL